MTKYDLVEKKTGKVLYDGIEAVNLGAAALTALKLMDMVLLEASDAPEDLCEKKTPKKS